MHKNLHVVSCNTTVFVSTPAEFIVWLYGKGVKNSAIYYTGHLLHARLTARTLTHTLETADIAYASHMENKVELVQKKSRFGYDYIAIKKCAYRYKNT